MEPWGFACYCCLLRWVITIDGKKYGRSHRNVTQWFLKRGFEAILALPDSTNSQLIQNGQRVGAEVLKQAT